MSFTILKKGRRGYVRPFPPPSLSKLLEKKLSYKKQGSEFMPVPAWGTVKLFNKKSASFPWGLLPDVLEITGKCQIKIMKRKPVLPRHNPKLRNYQIDAVKALERNYGGILSMPTGSGKTFTCLAALSRKSLVICPTKYLVEQWQEQVPDHVDVRTYQGIKDYSILKSYDIVVFDECHHVAAATLYRIAMKLDEQMVIGLSATPYREDGEELKVYGALGQVVYAISLRRLIDEGYLCDAVVDLVELDYADSEGFTYQEIYRDYIIDNAERNEAIVEKCFEYKGKKILILVSQIEHGEYLADCLKPLDCVFLCSKSKKKSFVEDIIIATSILDEGIDLPDREVIILATGGKSSIKVLQRIGRVLRTHPSKDKAIIVDFMDNTKYLDKHFKRRLEIYNENGFYRKGF